MTNCRFIRVLLAFLSIHALVVSGSSSLRSSIDKKSRTPSEISAGHLKPASSSFGSESSVMTTIVRRLFFSFPPPPPPPKESASGSTTSSSTGTSSKSSTTSTKSSGNSGDSGETQTSPDKIGTKRSAAWMAALGAAVAVAGLAVSKKRKGLETEKDSAISLMEMEAAAGSSTLKRPQDISDESTLVASVVSSASASAPVGPMLYKAGGGVTLVAPTPSSTAATTPPLAQSASRTAAATPLKTRAVTKMKELSGRFRGLLSKN